MKERVKKVMAQVFGLSADQITDESSPDTIESWDSLTHLNLVMALEQEFDVSFSEEQMVELLSFEIVIEAVRELLDSRPVPRSSIPTW